MRTRRLCVVSVFLALAGGLALAGPGDIIHTYSNPTPPIMMDENDYFGFCVSARGDDVIVGAWGDANAGADCTGAVHLFSGSTGNLIRAILNSTPDEFDYFGHAVAPAGTNKVLAAVPALLLRGRKS